jgi:hypothetical protein
MNVTRAIATYGGVASQTRCFQFSSQRTLIFTVVAVAEAATLLEMLLLKREGERHREKVLHRS